MLVSECVCDDDEVLDLPADCGPLIAAMLGGGERRPGPPYEHVHRFPEPETDDDGNVIESDAGPPEYVPFTIERGLGLGREPGTASPHG